MVLSSCGCTWIWMESLEERISVGSLHWMGVEATKARVVSCRIYSIPCGGRSCVYVILVATRGKCEYKTGSGRGWITDLIYPPK